MARRYKPKAMLMTVLLALALPASMAWGAAGEEPADGDAGTSAPQGSVSEEAEFEVNIKSLISERQRLDDAKARLAAMKQRFERRAKAKKPEKVEEPKPEPVAPTEPKQTTAVAPAACNAVEIPLAMEDAKSLMCLASSLYELGHYAKALSCYEQVDVSKLTDDDAAWLSFQKGNCQFFSGEYEKCERSMADVTSKHSETVWSKHAAAVIKDLHFWQQREAIIKAAEQTTQTSDAEESSP